MQFIARAGEPRARSWSVLMQPQLPSAWLLIRRCSASSNKRRASSESSSVSFPASRRRARRPAPGPGDRSRQRQPRQRDKPGEHSVPPRGEYTATLWPRSSTSPWRSATTTTRQHHHHPRHAGHPRRLFDRLGRYEPAATIAGFAINPFTATSIPELSTAIAHLCEVLRDPAYESLARKGEKMTTAAMATYAYDQIDQVRAELDGVSK